MSRQVSRGAAADYQADEQAGVAGYLNLWFQAKTTPSLLGEKHPPF